MGYVIRPNSERTNLLVSANESDFNNAKNGIITPAEGAITTPNTGIITVPSINPGKTMSRRASAGGDVTRTAPMFNDPRYTSSTLSIPTDQRTLNGLYRFFGETDPIVGSALRISTELPLADMRLGQCEDSGVQQHYEEMWDRINGRKMMSDITSELHEIGDVTPFAAFNEADYMWDQVAILNPDYVKIESTWLNNRPLIKLIPDEALKKIVHTQSPRFLYDQLPPDIIRYVMFNQEIPLDPNNVFLLSYAKRPYETRGKSLIKRILKTLMLEDIYNQANFALAKRHAVPLTVVKLGDSASIEGDHYVTYKSQDNNLHVETFDSMWDKLDGNVSNFDGGKQVKDIQQYGFTTQTVDSEGNYGWYKIEHILRHKTPENMLKLTTPVGDLIMTEGHGLVWLNPTTLKYERATPSQLEDRDYPVVVTQEKFTYEVDSKKVWGINITPDFAYFMGLWTADGYLARSKTSNQVRISVTDEGISRKVESLISLEDVEKIHVYLHKNRNERAYWIKHPKLLPALLQYYNYSKKGGNEKLPTELLFNSDEKIVGALFAGIMDGDGSITKSGSISICCGLPREYPHWLSLSLLSKGIVSKVTCKYIKPKVLKGRSKLTVFQPCYLLHIVGSDSKKKFVAMILPYLAHATKIEHAKLISDRIDLHQHTQVYDFDNEVVDNIFTVNDIPRCGKGELSNTYVKRHLNRISRRFLCEMSESSEVKRLERFFGVSVKNIESIEPSCEYVYDFMMEKNSSHCYLVAGLGWLQTHNSGWTPDEAEIDSVREMMAAWELDPNFTIIYHYGFQVEYYGSSGKTLPVGPELDRLYKLKFIGMNVHEQLLSGVGGAYSQAYVNLEVQRQRYLNLQLKLEGFVHEGLFKTVADLCGFYRIKQATVGYAGSRSSSFGSQDGALKHVLGQFSSLRDFKDNEEFAEFAQRKAAEIQNNNSRQMREYVYPKLDWGNMSAASDENLKNWVKWLRKEVPYLIDDATLARLARLDRDTQEKAYIEDLKRSAKRQSTIAKLGLLPYANPKPGGGGPMDLGGIGDISAGPTGGGGGDMGDLGGGGGDMGGAGGEGMPNAPIGAGGPPATSTGQVPPPGAGGAMPRASLDVLERQLAKEVYGEVVSDDLHLTGENADMMKKKAQENYALIKVVRS